MYTGDVYIYIRMYTYTVPHTHVECGVRGQGENLAKVGNTAYAYAHQLETCGVRGQGENLDKVGNTA
jgi:hypothetical protein